PATVKWRVSQAIAEPDRYLMSVTFNAVAEAEPSNTSAEVVAKVGSQMTNRRTFTVTVRNVDKQPADKPDGEKVAFQSADGVTLVGSWYAGAKGQDSPCALLLHDARESRRAAGWEALARSLQEKGFAVLTFDFRGHGDSTAVTRDFWDDATNRSLI